MSGITQNMSLQELLDRQDSVGVIATIHTTDNLDEVKVTPYRGPRGCGCDSAITVPKAAILQIELTGERHFCCGKLLEVVHITFKEGASLPIADVMVQLALARKPSGLDPHRALPRVEPRVRTTHGFSPGFGSAAIKFDI
jgi:hypothetical protein